jgi:hypothetical protein
MDYNIINMTPLEEIYLASNNLKYKHIYYIGQIDDSESNIFIDKTNITQSIEVGDIKWLKFNNALKIIRDYNIEKKYVLINLHISIKNIIDHFITISKKIIID